MVRTHEKISGLELEAAVLENALFRYSARDPRFDYYSMFWWAKTPLRPILDPIRGFT